MCSFANGETRPGGFNLARPTVVHGTLRGFDSYSIPHSLEKPVQSHELGLKSILADRTSPNAVRVRSNTPNFQLNTYTGIHSSSVRSQVNPRALHSITTWGDAHGRFQGFILSSRRDLSFTNINRLRRLAAAVLLLPIWPRSLIPPEPPSVFAAAVSGVAAATYTVGLSFIARISCQRQREYTLRTTRARISIRGAPGSATGC